MRTSTHRFAALAVLSLTLTVGTTPETAPWQGTSTPAAQPNVQRLGPQVGQRVPDFTLVDQDGRQRSLQSLMGEKGLILVFSRSADW
jgi:cytochrome oxidase Cu insertion factor (SCO1/SenC/PrrC family)